MNNLLNFAEELKKLKYLKLRGISSHPGNYAFLDNIQLSINKAKIEDCALIVLATIISHLSENLFICDAGAMSRFRPRSSW